MAQKFWNGSVNASWNNNSNWQTATGSATTFAVAGDDVYFATNNNITCNVASACNSIVFGTYSGTYTATNILSVAGPTVSLSPSQSFAGTSFFQCIGTTPTTFTSNGKTLGIGLVFANSTYTFTDAFAVSLTTTLANVAATYSGATLSCLGPLSAGGGGAIQQGTTKLVVNGNLSGNGALFLDTTLKPIGAVTYTGPNTINSTTLRYSGVSGSATHTSSLNCVGTNNLDLLGLTLSTVSFNGVTTGNLISNLRATTLNIAQTTFTGSGVWTTNNLTFGGVGTITLVAGQTYNILSSFINISPNNATRTFIKSSSAGTKAFLNLANGATCTVAFTNPTDIDSSGGRKINVFSGVLSNTINWRSFTDLQTVSYGSIN